MGRVLVTGGSGFIASHIIRELLRRKHGVVATVRSRAKIEAIQGVIPADGASHITYTIVEDVSVPHAFDRVFSDYKLDCVIHTAAPFHLRNATPEELLDPAVNGTKYLLDSVKRLGPTVKRFILTSSHSAVVDLSKLHRPGYVYSEKDWCPIDWETANGSNPVNNYCGAKKFGELAVWDFSNEYKGFDVVTICLPIAFGPLLIPPDSLLSLNTSTAMVYAYIDGTLKGAEVPPQFYHAWVDVRDAAEAHVTAYEKPEAANQRFIVSAGNHTHYEIARILAKNFPDCIENIPMKLHEGLTPDGEPTGGRHSFDASLSDKTLGPASISLEKSLVDAMNSVRRFGQSNQN